MSGGVVDIRPARAGLFKGAKSEYDSRTAEAFRKEEFQGLRFATIGRILSLATISVLLFIVTDNSSINFYYQTLLLGFVLIGVVQYGLARSRFARPWHLYVFVVLDFSLMAFTLIVPPPVAEYPLIPQLSLRLGNFIYYFVLLCAMATSYRPWLMVWAGIAGAASWAIGAGRVMLLPETILKAPDVADFENRLAVILNPRYVEASQVVQEVVVFLIVAFLLAFIVSRSRRLVTRQIEAERERSNLSRYFPPTIVDQLAHTDQPFASVRQQPAAVMFVDIVGFTKRAEGLEPGQVIALLREYHARLERAVFDHGGTLDKFIGDGIMATFGNPTVGERDAVNALLAARSILASIDEWNVALASEGTAPVRVSVGIHYGDVVIGDVGSERRLELAVLGDTVNIASRIEHLTRELGCQLAVSDDLMVAARAQLGGEPDLAVEDLTAAPPQKIRGRTALLGIWLQG